MSWFLAVAVAVSTGSVLCPSEDPLELRRLGDLPKVETWLRCKRLCERDRDCAVLEGTCRSWVFGRKDSRKELEAYYKALKPLESCPDKEEPPKPDAVCVEGECRPRTKDCESEKAEYRALLEGLRRDCRDASDCELYFLDPEPCRPPYILKRGLDLSRLEGRLGPARERVRLACGHALREHPRCAPPLSPFECAEGLCRPALP